MSLPIVLHHSEGAVVGYFMAYCGNVAIKLELSENYGAMVNVNVGFQPHSSSYPLLSQYEAPLCSVFIFFHMEQGVFKVVIRSAEIFCSLNS